MTDSDTPAAATTSPDPLDHLVERFGAMAYALAFAVTRETTLAEEAVGDGLREAALQAAETRGLLDPGELVLRFTRLRALELVSEGRDDTRRRRRRERRLLAAREVDLWSGTPPDAEATGSVIARLRNTQRQALEMAYARGYDSARIAHEVGASEDSVRARLRSALLELADAASASELSL
jgi:DNA-directed RNA polymerase specialized sigma24 family protein